MNEEILQEIEDTLQELSRLASDGAVIVVEGKKDVFSLSKLGINGRFFTVMNGSSMVNNMDELMKEREVIVLMDFDRRGREMVSFCKRHLSGVKNLHLNTEIWEKLKSLVGKYVKDVEGLASY
ncbi:MAG: toprim domain-containing protein, partial [Candidatus Hadarchaeales archaeon]